MAEGKLSVWLGGLPFYINSIKVSPLSHCITQSTLMLMLLICFQVQHSLKDLRVTAKVEIIHN